MTRQKIRAFLDTNVLLEYIRGKAELQRLFSEEVRERAAFVINAIVLQELLLSRNQAAELDFTKVEPYLDIVQPIIDFSKPETEADLRRLRGRGTHVNDILILFDARTCDVFLTYDKELLSVGEAAAIRSETPEEFLQDLDAAA
jgi:predicted nucleic acid-binding protein